MRAFLGALSLPQNSWLQDHDKACSANVPHALTQSVQCACRGSRWCPGACPTRRTGTTAGAASSGACWCSEPVADSRQLKITTELLLC